MWTSATKCLQRHCEAVSETSACCSGSEFLWCGNFGLNDKKRNEKKVQRWWGSIAWGHPLPSPSLRGDGEGRGCYEVLQLIWLDHKRKITMDILHSLIAISCKYCSIHLGQAVHEIDGIVLHLIPWWSCRYVKLRCQQRMRMPDDPLILLGHCLLSQLCLLYLRASGVAIFPRFWLL